MHPSTSEKTLPAIESIQELTACFRRSFKARFTPSCPTYLEYSRAQCKLQVNVIAVTYKFVMFLELGFSVLFHCDFWIRVIVKWNIVHEWYFVI